jgi:hypothetical protein
MELYSVIVSAARSEHTRIPRPIFCQYPGWSYRSLDKKRQKQLFFEAPNNFTGDKLSIRFNHSKRVLLSE